MSTEQQNYLIAAGAMTKGAQRLLADATISKRQSRYICRKMDRIRELIGKALNVKPRTGLGRLHD